MLNETGCCNSARNPAMPGTVAQLYATGAGQTAPRGTDGLFSEYTRLADYPVPQLPVEVTVGGIPAEILYAGEAPLHVTGTFVVNFRVPLNAPLGNAVPLVLTVGSSHSPDDVTMAIRSSVQRVLVVDHDPAIRQSLAKIFRGAGYQVFAARDGQEAAALAAEHPPDLMICDLAANDAAIRNIPKEHRRLKTIVTLAASSPENLRAADLLGARAVLTKPFTAQRLLQRSRELLAARPFP
jgi:CheY-like chemotaxis protein